MKFSDINFCAVCVHRSICPRSKEEPDYHGTMCLAWTGEKGQNAATDTFAELDTLTAELLKSNAAALGEVNA